MSTFTILNAIIFYKRAGQGVPNTVGDLAAFIDLFAQTKDEVVDFLLALREAEFCHFDNLAQHDKVLYNLPLIRQAVKQLGADQEQ